MAVVIFLSGFLLGLLALALAEGAAIVWAVRALRRGRPRPPSPPPEAAAAELSGDRPIPTEKQVRLLVFTLCTFLFFPIFLSSLLALQLEAKNGEVAGELYSVCRVETRPCGICKIFVVEFLVGIREVICTYSQFVPALGGI
jgi:hypothetical protein